MRRRAFAALLPACAMAHCARASTADSEDLVRRGRTLRFPRDHGAHPGAAIEWWYVTGELRDDADARWGFQITFFRARTRLATQLDSRFAARQLLFAHAALTELGADRHLHAQRIARWSGDPEAPLAGAALHDTDVRVGDWRLHREVAGGGSRYHTRFGSDRAAPPADAFELRLQLQATQPLLRQGDAGFSRKGPDETQASHYVSEPQLAVQGTLQRAGKSRPVSGRAWLDHEWSDTLMHPQAVGWDWIGMNLDDGSALTAFRLRRADGSPLWAGGSFRAANGATQDFDAEAVRFTPGRTWASPASGARYPLQWTVDTPVGRFEVRALLDAQELDSRASTGAVYWEGLSELRDAQGRRIGSGYLEMTGYAGRLQLGE
jgi:predicted secreted hydrolase